MGGKCKPVVWDGVEYPSRKALAKYLGVHRSTISFYIRRGWSGNADVKPRGLKEPVPTEWNGKTYPSRAAAARDNHICRQGMSLRALKGYTSDADMCGSGIYHCQYSGRPEKEE